VIGLAAGGETPSRTSSQSDVSDRLVPLFKRWVILGTLPEKKPFFIAELVLLLKAGKNLVE
jgi:hypothetical protein